MAKKGKILRWPHRDYDTELLRTLGFLAQLPPEEPESPASPTQATAPPSGQQTASQPAEQTPARPLKGWHHRPGEGDDLS